MLLQIDQFIPLSLTLLRVTTDGRPCPRHHFYRPEASIRGKNYNHQDAKQTPEYRADFGMSLEVKPWCRGGKEVILVEDCAQVHFFIHLLF